MTTTGAGLVDSTGLLGLSSRAARFVMWLFVASNFLYAVASFKDIKNSAPVLFAAVIIGAAAVLLVRGHADPFPLTWTLGILAAVLLSTVLVAWQLPDAGPIGRASWHLGSNTWLLFFLALRRRPGAAWLGYVGMTAITMFWTLSVGRSVMSAVSSLQTHAAILLVATLFALNLRRTARRINELHELSTAAAVEAAAGSASSQIREHRVTEIRLAVGQLLESLVRVGPPQSADDKLKYASAEALLRDGVRGRSLMTPVIAGATNAARARGVDVTLLDDRGAGLETPEAMDRLTDVVVEKLGSRTDGEVTVRLAPRGRRAAVSIVATGEGSHVRVELDDQGLALDSSAV